MAEHLSAPALDCDALAVFVGARCIIEEISPGLPRDGRVTFEEPLNDAGVESHGARLLRARPIPSAECERRVAHGEAELEHRPTALVAVDE